MLKKSLKYIIPSILTALLGGIYIIIDGFFVGNKLGDTGLAALNIAWPITGLIQSLGIGIGLAGGIYLSFAQGKNDKESEEKVLKTTYMSLLFVSILMMTLLFVLNPLLRLLGTDNDTHKYAYDYLTVILYGAIFQVFGQALIPIVRNYGKLKWVTIGMIVSSVMNFIGDYIFIYLLDLELIGAAIASIIGQATYAIIAFVVLLKSKKFILGKPNNNMILKIGKSMIAPFILNFSASFIIIIYNFRCLKYGGNEAVATYTVYAYLFFIVAIIAAGVGDGLQPIISYHYAKNEKDNVKEILKIGYIVANAICLIITIILFVLGDFISDGFSLEGTSKMMFTNGYIYFVIGFLFIATARMTMSYLYAIESVKLANLLVILEPFILSLIFLYTLPIWFKLDGVWITYMLCQIIVAIASVIIVLIKIRGEKQNV